jgi:hypothetical protein
MILDERDNEDYIVMNKVMAKILDDTNYLNSIIEITSNSYYHNKENLAECNAILRRNGIDREYVCKIYRELKS